MAALRRTARNWGRSSLLAALLVCAGVAGLRAQEPAATEQPRAEYERVSREITLSAERMEARAPEIEAVRKDHATIPAALSQSARTAK